MNAIRRATARDASAIAAIYAPWVATTCVTFETTAPDADEMVRRIEKHGDRMPWLVREMDERVVAYAYATPHRERAAYRWTVETSVYVATDRHRRGIGRDLYVTLLDVLARQGHRLALAIITLPNPQSVGFHESLGFTPSGRIVGAGHKLGGWRDVGWWSRELAPRGEEMPAEPRTISDVAAMIGLP